MPYNPAELEVRRILVLGKTYPSYSKKYEELSCIGGLLHPTLEMVRLHPVNFRALPPEVKFATGQWIEARIAKDTGDPRPESYYINERSIAPQGERLPPEKRRRLLEQSPHYFRSLEDLETRNEEQETSLGIILPKAITGWRAVPKPPSEYEEWVAKERAVMAQGRLFERPHPIEFPDLRFLIGWTCRDDRCTGHEFSLLDWGLHEFSRQRLDDDDRTKQVEEQMARYLDSTRDALLMLGNFRGHMRQFGLMGVLSAKHQHQPSLFEARSP